MSQNYIAFTFLNKLDQNCTFLWILQKGGISFFKRGAVSAEMLKFYQSQLLLQFSPPKLFLIFLRVPPWNWWKVSSCILLYFRAWSEWYQSQTEESWNAVMSTHKRAFVTRAPYVALSNLFTQQWANILLHLHTYTHTHDQAICFYIYSIKRIFCKWHQASEILAQNIVASSM